MSGHVQEVVPLISSGRMYGMLKPCALSWMDLGRTARHYH